MIQEMYENGQWINVQMCQCANVLMEESPPLSEVPLSEVSDFA